MTNFEVVYKQYFSSVYRYLVSLSRNESLAQELTQETFFKALKQIDFFKGECKMYVWLCQIAKNTYFSYLRKEKHSENLEDLSNVPSAEHFEDSIIQGESAFEVYKALHKMPEPYKEVLSLRIFGELSFAQIAELFGKTESWARVTYHRARIKLKEMLV